MSCLFQALLFLQCLYVSCEMQAPDATCEGEELVKATYSDKGYVIIGLLQDLGQLERNDENVVNTQYLLLYSAIPLVFILNP